MSKARKPSGLLQDQYDKILLLSALLVLAISSTWLLIGLGRNRVEIQPQDLEPAVPAKVVPLDTAPMDALAGIIDSPFHFPSGRKMLVGELRVGSVPDGLPIPYDATVCPFTGKPQPSTADRSLRDTDGDGMPDEWETKHGLNIYDGNDARVDTDGDGFSNVDESSAGTDPGDKASFPPPVAKLRLVKAQMNPFKLRFLGTSLMPNGDVVYQLNLRSLERTYFARMNGEVEGFEVTAFEQNTPEGPTLTLKQGDKSIRLVQGRVRDESAFTAFMVLLLDGKRFKSNIGETIALYDQTYKVVDIREDRVVIRDETTEKSIDIELISDEERAGLSAAPEPEKTVPALATPPPEQGN